MISAEVIKGVQELLEGHGVQQGEGEPFADFVARGLDHRSVNNYTIKVSSILNFHRKTTGSALTSSKY